MEQWVTSNLRRAAAVPRESKGRRGVEHRGMRCRIRTRSELLSPETSSAIASSQGRSPVLFLCCMQRLPTNNQIPFIGSDFFNFTVFTQSVFTPVNILKIQFFVIIELPLQTQQKRERQDIFFKWLRIKLRKRCNPHLKKAPAECKCPSTLYTL